MASLQTYSRDEIERYLQQKMSPREMHDFEKALMNDAFLADALEGFSNANRELAGKHLAEIEGELTGNDQKVIEMPFFKKTWWKVAVVVFVIVTGVLTYSLLIKKGSEKGVAAASAPRQVAPSPETASKPDSIGPVEKPLAKVEAFSRKSHGNLSESSSTVFKEKEKEGPSMAAVPMMKKDSQGIAMMDQQSAKARLSYKSAEGVSVLDNQKVTLGEINNRSKATAVQGNAKQNQISNLIDSNEALNKGIEPEGGWSQFKQYLKNQEDSLQEHSEGNNFNKQIMLYFKIDNNGNPVDIEPEDNADSSKVKRAIQILINGPKWKTTEKERKVQIIIPFG